MTIQLYAKPTYPKAKGFFFSSLRELRDGMIYNNDRCKKIIRAYTMRFVRGEQIDRELAEAWRVDSKYIAKYLAAVDCWTYDEKVRFIIAVGECGYFRSKAANDPNAIDMIVYELDSMTKLAGQLVEEGVFNEIPKCLNFCIDIDAIACDLEHDYSQVTIDGKPYIYRCE